MNTFGDFFYALRKEKGMTQAEIADLLGVTNKAVSKWETGESLPDTSMLKPIADTFGVTVDELLNGKRAESEKEENVQKNDNVVNGHLFTRGKDDEPETMLDKISGAVCACIMLSGIIVYLCLGAFKNLWHPYWVIIPVCAFCCGIAGIVFDMFNRNKRKKKLERGENPYIGGACGILMLSCCITYMLLGAVANLWHPYWIIMVVGGLICGIIAPIGKIFFDKK